MSLVWESFLDESYFNMWCIRPRGDKRFGVGFHLSNGDEAALLARALNRHKVFVEFVTEETPAKIKVKKPLPISNPVNPAL